MYIIKQLYLGNTFYLRSTIFTSHRDRADEFATVKEAEQALMKASKFMKKSQYNSCIIEEA